MIVTNIQGSLRVATLEAVSEPGEKDREVAARLAAMIPELLNSGVLEERKFGTKGKEHTLWRLTVVVPHGVEIKEGRS